MICVHSDSCACLFRLYVIVSFTIFLFSFFWESTASSTLFCCLLVCIYNFVFSSFASFENFMFVFTWTRLTSLVCRYRSVPVWIHTRRLCREWCCECARYLFTIVCTKRRISITEETHCRCYMYSYASFGWFYLYFCCCCCCCCYRAHVLKWNMQMGT